MGSHMARNLQKKGYQVLGYDTVEAHLHEVEADGITPAVSPEAIARECSAIITMLPSSPHVQDVYTGHHGLFNAVKKGTLLIDSSTIDPAVSKQMAEIAEEKGAGYMDAPVSGGVNAAKDGILTFMVGGEQFDRAKPILDLMAKNVIHCGHVGTGQAAKICNNLLLAISMIGTSEAMNLGIKLGLQPEMIAKVINMSTGRCWSSELYNPVPKILPNVPSSNDYKGGFGTALMTKDLGLAQNAATHVHAPTPLGSLAHQLYRVMCNSGYGPKDFSSTYQFLQEMEDRKF
ncbi:3-hydroxyisobutyrate dehydrogenase, mitochondrial-like isoform X2 [Tubulanus polymorphus]